MAWIIGNRRAKQRPPLVAVPLFGGPPTRIDVQPTPLARSEDLIIDVGAHRGCDTDFYLQKGFRVVAVEANPLLAEEIRDKFRPSVDSGRLVVLPYGIHEAGGEFTFYRNLDKDDWSSFKFEIGARDNTRYEAIPVQCVTFEGVLRKFGIPYYLKIDIEGHDGHVLDALLRLRALPKYLSVESHSLDYLARLRVLGYQKFKVVNQNKNWQVKCPYPPREGNYVDFEFGGHSSGPFGEESPGEWRTFEEVAYDYLHMWFGFNERHNLGGGWWDFHVKLDEAA